MAGHRLPPARHLYQYPGERECSNRSRWPLPFRWRCGAWPPCRPLAQTTAAEGPMQTVEVTGIRASMAKSLNVKKNATANVEVITAEDVGKMPDKNLADSLQRLAGVAVRTDYDEAEKVSMRGTNPDMSLILFNGHAVSERRLVRRRPGLELALDQPVADAVARAEPGDRLQDLARPTSSMAAWPAPSTSPPANRWRRKSACRASISGGASYADLAGQDRAGPERVGQLEERSRHLRRHRPGASPRSAICAVTRCRVLPTAPAAAGT